MQNFLQRLFSPRYLLATNAVLGTSLMITGDLVAQKLDIQGILRPKSHNDHHHANSDKALDSPKKELDFDRCKLMAAGGLYFGIACHYWYLFLDRKFQNKKRSVLKKLMCEAAAAAPFAGGLFVVTGLIRRQSPSAITNDFKNSIWYIVAADLFFFLPLQSINFYFLPTRYRFLYVGCITLVYDAFLSHIINNFNRDAQQ